MIDLKDLENNKIYLALSGTNPEFNSLYLILKPNHIKSRLYLNKAIFSREENLFFEQSCINTYEWTFYTPTNRQLKWMEACVKANKYIPFEKIKEEFIKYVIY